MTPHTVTWPGRRFALVVAGLLAGAALAAGAAASATAQTPPAGKSVTALGTGQVTVTPRDRQDNASIVAAVAAAEAKAVPRALAAARERATALAQASGLTLGAVQSVAEVPPSPFGAYYGAYPAPFGNDRYCGDERRPRYRRSAGGKRVRAGTRVVHVCRPPRFAVVNVSVTFAAS